MTIQNVLSLLGGLALFLYGMHMMSVGLETAAGDRMKAILEKLTSNRLLGVAVGAGITAVIQSSSATTVMVVGFVNSGLMTLNQAVWIIMGANIGTTITGQLIALDASRIAPLVAIIGVVMVTFLKGKRINSIGDILAGLGILFIGMDMMSNSMTAAGLSCIPECHDLHFQSAACDCSGSRLYCTDSKLLRIRWNITGSGFERTDSTVQLDLYHLRTEYRYLHYRRAGIPECEPKCQADNHYSLIL